MSTAISLRLGINKQHVNIWNSQTQYTEIFHQDRQLRDFLKNTLDWRLNDICIERTLEKVYITVYINPPFVHKASKKKRFIVPSKHYKAINNVLKSIYNNANVVIRWVQVAKFNFTKFGKLKNVQILKKVCFANLVAGYIAFFLRKDIKTKRYFKKIKGIVKTKFLEKAPGLLGYCIRCAGPFKRSGMARTIWIKRGKVPRNTLENQILFSFLPAHTLFGVFGIKVWLFFHKNVDAKP